MPKKNSSWGSNSKAVEARERKANQKRSEAEVKQKANEDAYWKDDNKLEQKKLAKKENEQRKKQEALKRKEDNKKLLEEEESKNPTSSKVTDTKVKKVTQIDIEKSIEKERKQREEVAQLKERERQRVTDNPVMEEENPNRKMAEILAAEGGVEARNVEDAIGVLSIDEAGNLADKHPEKRMKAAYAEYLERELPLVKKEYPNLRLSQQKQIIYKEWQKSPDNPLNQR